MSGKQSAGVVLIVIGLLSGASAAASNARPAAKGEDPNVRLGEAIGGFGVTAGLVIAGAFLAITGRNPPPDSNARRSRGRRRLKCDLCGALHRPGEPPAQCERCHQPWSGREVTVGGPAKEPNTTDPKPPETEPGTAPGQTE